MKLHSWVHVQTHFFMHYSSAKIVLLALAKQGQLSVYNNMVCAEFWLLVEALRLVQDK